MTDINAYLDFVLVIFLALRSVTGSVAANVMSSGSRVPLSSPAEGCSFTARMRQSRSRYAWKVGISAVRVG